MFFGSRAVSRDLVAEQRQLIRSERCCWGFVNQKVFLPGILDFLNLHGECFSLPLEQHRDEADLKRGV